MKWKFWRLYEPVDIPPRPRPNEAGYVEWVSRYSPVPIIRLCALKVLNDVAQKKYEEERLRRIIREEFEIQKQRTEAE